MSDSPFRRGLSLGKEFLTSLPQRPFPWKTYPQRQVAGESRDLSLGKRLNVVVESGIWLLGVVLGLEGYELFGLSDVLQYSCLFRKLKNVSHTGVKEVWSGEI
nr:hypothetical protein [Tanacetum cinerariifolium]